MGEAMSITSYPFRTLSLLITLGALVGCADSDPSGPLIPFAGPSADDLATYPDAHRTALESFIEVNEATAPQSKTAERKVSSRSRNGFACGNAVLLK